MEILGIQIQHLIQFYSILMCVEHEYQKEDGHVGEGDGVENQN